MADRQASAQRDAPDDAPAPAVLLGPFRLEEKLGTGPDGATYAGRDDDGCAVRIVRLAETEDDRLWARARRLRLAGLVRDEGVVPVEASLLSHPPYAVLRGVGAPWFDPQGEARIDRSTMRDDGVLIARGLAAMHGVGLFAGDLGPSRVVLDRAGRPRVDMTGLCADGVDRLPDGLAWAPEVMSGAFVGSADVYSLAALLVWAAYGLPDGIADLDAEARAAAWRGHVPASDPLAALYGSMLSDAPESRPSAARVARLLSMVPNHLLQPSTVPGPMPSGVRAGAETDPLPDLAGYADTDADHPPDTSETGPVDAAARPDAVGRFALGKLLGEGAMGRVYESTDPADGARVALKIMRRALLAAPRFKKRFDKEVRLLRAVRHPRIANLVDAGVHEGLPYLALEFIEGSPLSMVLQRERRFEPPAALAVIADVLRALVAVHAAGIVHRDIKPANVMVCGAGAATSAVLCDFGIARLVDQDADDRLTAVGTLVGTPHYMSPEQARGLPVDGRSDLYAVGVMLYELLAGEPPFDGPSPTGLLLRHIQDPPPPLSRARPDLPEPIAAWVHRLLAKEADGRPADAPAALDEALRLLRGDPADERLHPPLPEQGGFQGWVWSWDLVSPPDALWALVSDTRRINRAMGLQAFDVEPRHAGDIPYFEAGHRLAGLEARWDEQPMEWIEGRRIGNLRVYRKGALHWMRAVTDLEALPNGGTRVTQTVQVRARYGFTRLVASYEAGVKTRKAYAQLFTRMDAWVQARSAGNLDQSLADPFEAGHKASPDIRKAIELAHRRLQALPLDPHAIERLVRYVSEAPPPALNRIRPLMLAERFQVEPTDLIEVCLHAVREGLLRLVWDLMCPVCRVPTDIVETLAEIEDHARCTACQLDFDLDFAGSVELVFQPHPDIRAVDEAMYCMGGPAQSPHIAVQLRLAPGERLAIDLQLSDGAWRFAGRGLPYATIFRVHPDAPSAEWDLDLTPAAADALPRSLRSGRQRVTFANAFDHDVLLRVERLTPGHDALTAADAMGIETFRALFPHECLSPGALVNVARVTLLRTAICEMGRIYADDGPRAFARLHTHFDRIRRLVADHGGGVVKVEGDGLVCRFDEPGQAVRAAFAIAEAEADLTLRLAVNGGPAYVATLDGRLDYFGRTVHQTALLLARARPAQLVLAEPLSLEPAVARALADRRAPEVIQLADGALGLRFGVRRGSPGEPRLDPPPE